MDPFFIWVEESPLSRWVVGSSSFFAFEGIIVLHTIGVGLVAGPNLAIALRILGVARQVPLNAMRGFLKIVWVGLPASVLSGVLLLIGYPTKALTNPVFYFKLACIAVAVVLMVRIRRTLLAPAAPGAPAPPAGEATAIPSGARLLAWASIGLWVAAITAGRLLAYTHSRLTALSY
jgi:hypothetical protein